MASSSGTYIEGNNSNQQQQLQQGHGHGNSVSVSSYNNNNNGSHSVSGHGGEWGVPTFQHQQTISMEWTPEEQSILENGLSNYASESNIIRYAKIAVQLKNKTVRDVALRCRWMTKKEMKKKRKEDTNVRKVKDRKEMVIDSCVKPPRLAIQSNLSHAPGMVSNGNDDGIAYNDISGATRQLLQQNAWALKQISSNLATHQMHENIGLLSKARDNIFQILINLNEMAPTTKKMGPLPKLNEDLANSILPPPSFPIQL